MAIEDQKHEELVTALKEFMALPRPDFVRKALVKLAMGILRHYGYDVVEAPIDAQQQ